MKKKITNIELARESGLTVEYISYLLTSKRTPTKKTSIKLSEATTKLGIKTASKDWMYNVDKVRKQIRGEKNK